MPFERERLLTALDIPHLHSLVKTSADDPPTVRTERHTVDTAGMPIEREHLPAVRGIPDFHGRVTTSAADPVGSLQTSLVTLIGHNDRHHGQGDERCKQPFVTMHYGLLWPDL